LSTSPPIPPPAAPTIPLTAEIRDAYQDLSDKYQNAFETSTDLAYRKELLAWKTDVDNILTKDREYRFKANTALLKALLLQISSTNTDLVKIRTQIIAVASDIATTGEIIAAINKVLSLVSAA
jgi:hypothetical protein